MMLFQFEYFLTFLTFYPLLVAIAVIAFTVTAVVSASFTNNQIRRDPIPEDSNSLLSSSQPAEQCPKDSDKVIGKEEEKEARSKEFEKSIDTVALSPRSVKHRSSRNFSISAGYAKPTCCSLLQQNISSPSTPTSPISSHFARRVASTPNLRGSPQEHMSQALKQHKLLAEEAHRAISAALDFESLSTKPTSARVRADAIECYRKGLRDIKAALKIQFISDDERKKAESLNIKLRSHMDQVEERIAQLTATSVSQNSTPINSVTSTTSARPRLKSVPSILSSRQQQQRIPPSKRSSNPVIKGVDQALTKEILDEVLVSKPSIGWDDIVGLENAKRALKEIVILPSLRPELFTGLRAPAKGLLLFGPPGTGKTMLAKAVANESKATFFSISASSLTRKFVGEGEKMVKALFACARQLQPSVIFIDEIDSIMTSRNESEHEASRRLKTEFLLQFDGVTSTANERVLVMAATNRPAELDEAALRRLVKRIYIPLPEPETRKAMFVHLLEDHRHTITKSEIDRIVALTEGYSGSDITALAREASLGPIRALGDALLDTPADNIHPIGITDFRNAIMTIRPSVSPTSLTALEKWNRFYGTSE